MAAARPVELTRHGDVRVDPYYWLRDRENPEVIAYLEAENAYTERVLAPTTTLQDRIFDEIRGRVQETDVSPPARKGPWEYFTRTFEGSQYASHGRRPTGTPEGMDETVLLDENELATGLEYFSLGGLALSPDQTRLAYSFDDDGGELHSLRFRDLASGADLPDVIDGVYYGLAWANDNATVFYVRPDDAMRPFQVWRHTVGADTDDVLVFEEPDERFFVSVGRARSGRAIILSSDSKLTSESRLLDPGRSRRAAAGRRAPDRRRRVRRRAPRRRRRHRTALHPHQRRRRDELQAGARTGDDAGASGLDGRRRPPRRREARRGRRLPRLPGAVGADERARAAPRHRAHRPEPRPRAHHGRPGVQHVDRRQPRVRHRRRSGSATRRSSSPPARSTRRWPPGTARW